MIAGRFRIERLVGRGGMGSVYRAIDITDDRPVAIKVALAHIHHCGVIHRDIKPANLFLVGGAIAGVKLGGPGQAPARCGAAAAR